MNSPLPLLREEELVLGLLEADLQLWEVERHGKPETEVDTQLVEVASLQEQQEKAVAELIFSL